jgi:tetratricopeptide (TPR) repeat protein
LRELVVSGGEGNPFFMEEILKMLIDQKVIVPEDEQWRIEPERLLEARVPPTLAGVLQARLDGLAPPERAVLQRASVIGRVFWDRALEALFAPGQEPGPGMAEGTLAKAEILDALEGLRRKELIFRREASGFGDSSEFVFKHELLRNATYESVLRRLRRELHARVARWLITQSGERISESAGLVAGHFEQAGRMAEAAEWYGRAGQQARAGYEPAAAIEYLHKALDLLPSADTERREFQAKRVEWLEGLSESLGAQARFGEAIEIGTRMRSLAESAADLLAQARAWNLISFLEERRSANRASVQAAETAEKLAQAAGESGRQELIRALHYRAWAFYRLAEWDAVLAIARQTLELCSQQGDRRGLATSLKLRGVVNLQRGDYAEAERCFEQGLTICRELGDRRNAAAMWNNLGETARIRGDFAAAVESYQKALAISRQIRSRESEFIYVANLNGARLGLAEFQRVEQELRAMLPLAASHKSSVLSEASSFLSEACLGQEKVSEALESAEQALALARESGNELDLGIAWRALGRAKTRMPDVEGHPSGTDPDSNRCDPPACFEESLALFKKMNSEAEQARTLRAWAEFDLWRKDFATARQKLATVQTTFERLGMKTEAERTANMTPK